MVLGGLANQQEQTQNEVKDLQFDSKKVLFSNFGYLSLGAAARDFRGAVAGNCFNHGEDGNN